ncbi:hypothetical protein AVEN_61376-1 [Araneus ventricosus]|uniref:Uncharacterized protein n=1 Tax=Araneus ventricosus TaxID=182803 RepID=A0A4Y2G0K9_ARAVE|nr:hypothetical protein AVEN_61376-1 [Araneus ventricosus]
MLTKSQKHPILLPKTDHVVNLIITDYHLKLLHAGPQLIQAALREKFWILSARDAVRRVVRKCIPCFRNRPKLAEQIMGELPKSRVCPSSVFHRTGLDFAGPFLIRSSKGRGSRNTKCYICVFVCFATKAVHLEVVSDLTSRAFIACLKRFVARRGRPSDHRKLVKDRFPLPLIEDVLDKLQDAKVYSTLDLKNGFFHVEVNEDYKHFTSFVVPDGQFEFNKVPFGSVQAQVYSKDMCIASSENLCVKAS